MPSPQPCHPRTHSSTIAPGLAFFRASSSFALRLASFSLCFLASSRSFSFCFLAASRSALARSRSARRSMRRCSCTHGNSEWCKQERQGEDRSAVQFQIADAGLECGLEDPHSMWVYMATFMMPTMSVGVQQIFYARDVSSQSYTKTCMLYSQVW